MTTPYHTHGAVPTTPDGRPIRRRFANRARGQVAAPFQRAVAALGPLASPDGRITAGVEWTISFVALLLYVFVVHSFRLNVAAIAILIALGGVFLQGKPLRLPAPLVWFGAFWAWAFASSFASQWPDVSREATIEFAKIGIIFFVAYNAIQTRAQLRFFVFWTLAMYALFPVRGTIFNFLAGIGEFGRYAWNFVFQNPNDLAAYTLLIIGWCVAMSRARQAKWIRLASLGGVLVLSFIVVITQSRGGIIALTVMWAVTFWREITRMRIKTWLLLGAAAAVLAVMAPDSVWERIRNMRHLQSTETLGQADSSAEQRFTIWRVAARVIRDHPVAGVGFGAYPQVNSIYAGQSRELRFAGGKRDTHSMYLNVLAETGVIGLLLFSGMIISTLVALTRAIRRMKAAGMDEMIQFVALRAAFVGFLFAAIFGTVHRVSFMYLFIASATLAAEFALNPPGGGDVAYSRSVRRR